MISPISPTEMICRPSTTVSVLRISAGRSASGTPQISRCATSHEVARAPSASSAKPKPPKKRNGFLMKRSRNQMVSASSSTLQSGPERRRAGGGTAGRAVISPTVKPCACASSGRKRCWLP